MLLKKHSVLANIPNSSCPISQFTVARGMTLHAFPMPVADCKSPHESIIAHL